jgi:hypothetical protein
MSEKNYSMFPVYARSKLANVIFTVELQRRIHAKNLYLAAYAVHPGLVMTEVRGNKFLLFSHMRICVNAALPDRSRAT